MENTFKFKQAWFEILNKCSRELRTDVIEAVFQYYFTGAEPSFTDAARMLAFGFIRAEIDATRARREARKARQNKALEPVQMPEKPMETPTPEETKNLYSLAKLWNSIAPHSCHAPVPISGPFDANLFAPALKGLRSLGYNHLFDAVQMLRGSTSKVPFPDFFASLLKKT